MVNQFYLTHRWVLLLQVRVDLGVMAMKGYCAFSKALGLEHHH